MIKADFTQDVSINGINLYVSDMSIRESVDEVISQYDFRVHSSVNSDAAMLELTLGADIIINQSAQGRSITWRGQIDSISEDRRDHADTFIIKCVGEAEKLTRIRFTYLFEATTASDVILEAMANFGQSTGISTAGVESNTTNVGVMVSREDTLYDIINKVSKRCEFSWRVENGVLEFFDPQTQPAPFNIASNDNIITNSLSLDADIGEVRNVLKAEAYQYDTVQISKNVDGCTNAVYGPKFDANVWELADDPIITSPYELTPEYLENNALDSINIKVDLFSGRIALSRPCYVEGDPADAKDQNINLKLSYQVRRKLLVENRNVASISQYGERHGIYYPGNGGDDVETVFTKLGAELDRKAFPLITGSCQVADFGLRAGDWVVVSPLASSLIEPASMRVSSVRHTVNKADMQIDVELSSINYMGSDPVPEVVNRVENLEKRSLDPRSITGRVIRETGNVIAFNAPSESLKLSETIDVVIAQIAQFNGGGSVNKTSFGFEGIQGVLFSGGGEFSSVRYAFGSGSASMTGGGDSTASYAILNIFDSTAPSSGGGEINLFAGQLVDNSRTDETGITRATEDGIIRVIE